MVATTMQMAPHLLFTCVSWLSYMKAARDLIVCCIYHIYSLTPTTIYHGCLKIWRALGNCSIVPEIVILQAAYFYYPNGLMIVEF